MRLARILLSLGCLFAGCIALSTIHPWGNPRTGSHPDASLLEGSHAPDTVRAMLAAKCGDCHSNRTRYPLYAHIAPVSWLLERDIHNARNHMNMTEWQFMNIESRISVLTRMAAVVRSGEMPPGRYVMLHPGARLSPDEQQQIYDWARMERKRIRQETRQESNQSSTNSEAGMP